MYISQHWNTNIKCIKICIYVEVVTHEHTILPHETSGSLDIFCKPKILYKLLSQYEPRENNIYR